MELSGLSKLIGVSLADNNLRGEIPAELGEMTRLKRVTVARNHFSGCIPAGLREVESNDLASLPLLAC